MKIGIAGAGMIVPTFLDAAALVENMEIHALYARKEEAERLKREITAVLYEKKMLSLQRQKEKAAQEAQ